MPASPISRLPNQDTVAVENTSPSSLWDAYQQLKSKDRMMFPLEGAKQLGVSELELMLASPYSQYLGQDVTAMLHALSNIDKVESIVRNELAVHEKTGRIENLSLGKQMGIALNVGRLDLRFFIHRWQHVLAVTDVSLANEDSIGSWSIQFYDKAGRCIEKIFLRDYSDTAIKKWQYLTAQYEAQAKDTVLQDVIDALPATAQPNKWQVKILAADKQEKLQRKWLGLTDVHQFHMLLKSLDVDRASSYHQAPEGMAYPLQIEAIEALLTLAQHAAKPIMVFVGNSGIVQIQTGVVDNVKRLGDWINILDKAHNDFTLHLKDKALAQVWCVKRPTKDGEVTCIEGFDDYGNSIVTFFGERQEGQPERDYWWGMTDDLIARYRIAG